MTVTHLTKFSFCHPALEAVTGNLKQGYAVGAKISCLPEEYWNLGWNCHIWWSVTVLTFRQDPSVTHDHTHISALWYPLWHVTNESIEMVQYFVYELFFLDSQLVEYENWSVLRLMSHWWGRTVWSWSNLRTWGHCLLSVDKAVSLNSVQISLLLQPSQHNINTPKQTQERSL